MSNTDLFARQHAIPEIGEEGQRKLAESSVLVIGAGGLGAPVIAYLACAGVGTIVIADGDEVEFTNLNRQFLHGIDDVGKNKARSAAESAGSINKVSKLVPIESFLEGDELAALVSAADCVVNCVDSYAVRTEVARACLLARVPLVEAGVSDLYGWVLCIDNEHACLECAGLRDIVEESSPAVLGASIGVIGSVQALECIKILLDSPDVGFGQLVNFDGRHLEIESVTLPLDTNCEAHRLARDTF
ncbi:MAG: HesA/MoeB/ThiF family protein [Coriobacteriia bacterium]|nr:HesA/MoeB/ThiF family protein [Coriobacteriia bacterium]